MRKKVIEEIQDNSEATFDGWQDNYEAMFKEGQDNVRATFNDWQYNGGATFKKGQDNCGATFKRDMIIKNMIIVNENSEASKLIKEFSNDREWEMCTLSNFIKFIQERKQGDV